VPLAQLRGDGDDPRLQVTAALCMQGSGPGSLDTYSHVLSDMQCDATAAFERLLGQVR
jgi:hypothetical protein